MGDRKTRITQEECEKRTWPHNHRCRYTHGFECEDCGVFFPIDSIGYKRHEHPSTLWMAIWNLGAGEKPKVTDRAEIDRLIKICDGLHLLPDETLLVEIAKLEAWLLAHGVRDATKATSIELKDDYASPKNK